VIDLQGQAASGSGAWFAWSQPTRPTFRDLAPVLRQSGFRDGDPYYAAGGGERRMVLARASAADFVARYLLPRALLPLPATASPVQVAAPSVSLLGLADETAGLVDVVGESRGETRWGVCLASAGSAAGASSDGFWQAAYLAFGGGPGGRTAAGLALRDVVRSARATGEGSAASIEKAPLAALLEAASAAMAAEFWEPLLGDVSFAPALDVRRARVPGPAAYSTPASALALWRDVAAGRAQGCEALTPSRGAAQ
jgi:predicted RNA-binding Zn ribbon-like protein